MADITWMEVVDSAIKIGLGAVIGGIATYVTTKTTHDHDSRKEYIKRRRDMLDKIVDDLDGFSQHLMDYWANVNNALFKKANSQRLTDKELEEIQEKENTLFNSFKDLHTVESRLLLLSEKKMSDNFTEYSELAKEFFRKSSYENPDLTSEIMNNYHSNLKIKRQNLILGLSKTYISNKEPKDNG